MQGKPKDKKSKVPQSVNVPGIHGNPESKELTLKRDVAFEKGVRGSAEMSENSNSRLCSKFFDLRPLA